jgi:creatinine amidohydrolase
MKIAEMNWSMVEEYRTRDDRAVLPIGCTEQHALLSLATDSILAERVAVEAAAPLGIPVYPVMPYGITPSFRAYPGTVSLRIETLLAVVRDILDSLHGDGFRRILVVNGHGGNAPVQAYVGEWMALHSECTVQFHNWWNAPRVSATVREIDPVASHASWMENFAWTRIAGVVQPAGQKPMIDLAHYRVLDPRGVRDYLGEGNFGGRFERSEADMAAVWAIAVEEARALLTDGWR